jgi:hypothetical protein
VLFSSTTGTVKGFLIIAGPRAEEAMLDHGSIPIRLWRRKITRWEALPPGRVGGNGRLIIDERQQLASRLALATSDGLQDP